MEATNGNTEPPSVGANRTVCNAQVCTRLPNIVGATWCSLITAPHWCHFFLLLSAASRVPVLQLPALQPQPVALALKFEPLFGIFCNTHTHKNAFLDSGDERSHGTAQVAVRLKYHKFTRSRSTTVGNLHWELVQHG